MGYERLRANQGFYLHTSNFPFAELWVNLRYNSLTSMYTFEDTSRQFHAQQHYTDGFNDVFQNLDNSLRAWLPHIMAADDKAYYNYRTNIYLEALDQVYVSNTTVGSKTEVESIYMASNEILIRKSYKGIVNILNTDGKIQTNLANKQYYKYVKNLVYRLAITPCLPPYDDYLERKDASGTSPCPNLQSYWRTFEIQNQDVPVIAQCFIGMAPFTCPTLANHTVKLDEFAGYEFDVVRIKRCVAFKYVNGVPNADEVLACNQPCTVDQTDERSVRDVCTALSLSKEVGKTDDDDVEEQAVPV